MAEESGKSDVQRRQDELKNKVGVLKEQLTEVRGRMQTLSAAPAKERRAVVNRLRCTGCGLCEKLCPADAIRVTYLAHIDPDRCTGCGVCVQNCPEGAIRLAASPPTPSSESPNG